MLVLGDKGNVRCEQLAQNFVTWQPLDREFDALTITSQ